MHDEELWKGRFHQLMLVRLASLATLMLGLAITFGDLVRDGGSPRLGSALVIVGAVASLVAPRLLKKKWKQP